MEFFKYKTIGNVYPQGKPKVYFSSHPDDFERYFESVCSDVFSLSNCSIWYLENQDTDFELYCESLKQMHLIVIPITTQLLTTENKTINQEFKYAIENNIPILPLCTFQTHHIATSRPAQPWLCTACLQYISNLTISTHARPPIFTPNFPCFTPLFLHCIPPFRHVTPPFLHFTEALLSPPLVIHQNTDL